MAGRAVRDPVALGRLHAVRTTELGETFQEIEASDVVVASRLHGVIFALLLARPVLALSYDWKVRKQMEDAALGDFVLEST